MSEQLTCSLCGKPIGTPRPHGGHFAGRVGYLEVEIKARDGRYDNQTEVCFACVYKAVYELYFKQQLHLKQINLVIP